MAAKYPLTAEQFHQIELDLAEMRVRAEEIFHLMSVGCGESDPRALRAEEVTGALQRLQWAMERMDDGRKAFAAGETLCIEPVSAINSKERPVRR
jgi:hypothetical protein